MAAVSVGAGATLAQASEAAAPARPAASSEATLTAAQARALLADPAVSAELKAQDTTSLRAVAAGTATDVQARGAVGGAAKALFNLLKKHGGKIYSGAVKAAKGNWGKFRSYMDGLPWYHPVRLRDRNVTRGGAPTRRPVPRKGTHRWPTPKPRGR
ncbi:hypothetical protein VSS38_23305 [Streptomyces albogriseolus]|uniref:hypothetical protein n=1 Tax=Streptomyces albogriseolus TaxID=1887 RepID=UPI0035D747AA